MKKLKKFFHFILFNYSKIHLVDKCLMIFMFILLMQSAYTLLLSPSTVGEAHTIDVIVRTSISGIFGYFLSVNFIRQESSGLTETSNYPPPPILTDSGESHQKNSIGFTAPAANTKLQPGSVDFTTSPQPKINQSIIGKLQILVASFIGIFCLLSLIVVRDLCLNQLIDATAPSFVATVSQFRDLISSCVGFLIGCPTDNKKF